MDDSPLAPVLLMRSLPARSHRVSLPTLRTPVAGSVVAACTISRQCDLHSSKHWSQTKNLTLTLCCVPEQVANRHEICRGTTTSDHRIMVPRGNLSWALRMREQGSLPR